VVVNESSPGGNAPSRAPGHTQCVLVNGPGRAARTLRQTAPAMCHTPRSISGSIAAAKHTPSGVHPNPNPPPDKKLPKQNPKKTFPTEKKMGVSGGARKACPRARGGRRSAGQAAASRYTHYILLGRAALLREG